MLHILLFILYKLIKICTKLNEIVDEENNKFDVKKVMLKNLSILFEIVHKLSRNALNHKNLIKVELIYANLKNMQITKKEISKKTLTIAK